MKRLTVRMVIALVVCALAGSMALAKVKSNTVTFGVDFVVGDSLVKRGTYKLSFDDKTNELTVLDKDKTIVAKAVARLEDRKSAISGMEVILAQKGEKQALISLAFPGDSKSIVLNAQETQTATAQK